MLYNYILLYYLHKITGICVMILCKKKTKKDNRKSNMVQNCTHFLYVETMFDCLYRTSTKKHRIMQYKKNFFFIFMNFV